MKERDDLGKDNRKRKEKEKENQISFRNRDGWLKHNCCTTVCGCKENWRSLTIAGFDGRERETERRGIELQKKTLV